MSIATQAAIPKHTFAVPHVSRRDGIAACKVASIYNVTLRHPTTQHHRTPRPVISANPTQPNPSISTSRSGHIDTSFLSKEELLAPIHPFAHGEQTRCIHI